MLKDIDHIGIAVNNLDQIKETYRIAFNKEPDFEEEISDQHVNIVGYRIGRGQGLGLLWCFIGPCHITSSLHCDACPEHGSCGS